MNVPIRPTSWPGALIASLVHAGLFALAFPPYNLWPLSYLALIPLALLALRATSRPRAVLSVWLMSTLAWLWVQRWLIEVTGPGYVLLAMVQGAFPAFFVWMLATLRPRGGRPLLPGLTNVLLVPLLWVGTEMLRGSPLFLSGYPWFFLAHPLIAQPVLCQSADLLGTYFVSFTAAMVAGLLADVLTLPMFHKGRVSLTLRASLGVFVATQAFVLGYGLWRVSQTNAIERDGMAISIAAVQTNLPQNNKQAWTLEAQFTDFAHFVELTRLIEDPSAKTQPPDLVVWPETMAPGLALNIEAMRETKRFEITLGRTLPSVTFFYEQLSRLAQELHLPLLVGSSAVDELKYSIERGADANGNETITPNWEWKARYNSALLFGSDGRLAEQRYDKVHRTPFGEVIPIAHSWPAVQQWLLNLGAKGMKFDLDAGKAFTRIEVPLAGKERPSILAGTPICFESTMPYVCRLLTHPANAPPADVLINLTNDGWFGSIKGGREQHLQVGRFRCIENRVPMVRAANTGISAAIDSAGRLIQMGPNLPGGSATWNSEGVMIASVRLDSRRPLYGLIGDAFGWVCLGLSAAMSAWALLAGRVTRRSGEETP